MFTLTFTFQPPCSTFLHSSTSVFRYYFHVIPSVKLNNSNDCVLTDKKVNSCLKFEHAGSVSILYIQVLHSDYSVFAGVPLLLRARRCLLILIPCSLTLVLPLEKGCVRGSVLWNVCVCCGCVFSCLCSLSDCPSHSLLRSMSASSSHLPSHISGMCLSFLFFFFVHFIILLLFLCLSRLSLTTPTHF